MYTHSFLKLASLWSAANFSSASLCALVTACLVYSDKSCLYLLWLLKSVLRQTLNIMNVVHLIKTDAFENTEGNFVEK